MPSTPLHKRDSSIDLIKGVALIVIFIDHMTDNPLRSYTPGRLGFSDMAEVFFFLSGYVLGTLCLRQYATHGFRMVCFQCWKRMATLYLLSCVFSFIYILIVTHSHGVIPPAITSDIMDTPHDVTSLPLIASVFLCLQLPIVFSVLPVYALFLLVLPFYCALSRRTPWGALGIAAGVYLSTQIWPGFVKLPSPWDKELFFNPFSWQIIFFSGVAIATDAKCKEVLVPQSPILIVLAIIFVEYSFYSTVSGGHTTYGSSEKAVCALWRVLHFFSLLIAGRFLKKILNALAAHSWSKPIQACGRHSLWTYLLSGFIALYGSILLSGDSNSLTTVMAVNIAGSSVLISVGFLLEIGNNIKATRSMPSVVENRA